MGTPLKLGRPADEDLPEVVQQQPLMASSTPLPEVVPDSSPEFAQQRYYIETDKYPAYYDTAPKLPHEQPSPGVPSPEQQYQQQYQHWAGAEHGVSALSPNSSVPWQSFPPGDDQQTYVGSEPRPEKRICGLRKRLFIIIAVIVGLVIVGAAIGGGVGGSMAARKASSDAAEPAETASASSGATGATPTTPSKSSTTSTAPTPTISFLNNQTDPAIFQRFKFQAWAKHDFEGAATPILYEEGFFDLKFNATSYIWLPDESDCCVTFCSKKSKGWDWGYRCDLWKRNATDNAVGFSRVSIWCGRWDTARNEKMKQKCEE